MLPKPAKPRQLATMLPVVVVLGILNRVLARSGVDLIDMTTSSCSELN